MQKEKKGKDFFDGKFFLKEGQGCVDLFVLCCDCGAWWCSLMPSTTTTTTTTRGNGGQSLCAHQNLTPHLQPLLPLLLLLTHCQCPAPPLPALPCQPSTHHHHPSRSTHIRFTAQQTCSTNQHPHCSLPPHLVVLASTRKKQPTVTRPRLPSRFRRCRSQGRAQDMGRSIAPSRLRAAAAARR